MALTPARALGADTSLFARSPGTEPDARLLGANRFVLSTDAAQMAAAKGQFDLIIGTVPYAHDLNPHLPPPALGGTLVPVGYLGDLDAMLKTTPLLIGRKLVAGSIIGGIAETQEMLDFCGQHDITSEIEVIRIQDINAAYERILKIDVKYCLVIELASLRA